ncbi:MAG: hypothetical protein ABFC42_10265 [Sulfuricella sp.]
MSNNMTDLQAILFDTLRGIKAGTVDLDKAKAINDIGKTLVDTARAENDYIKATGANAGSGFIAPSLPPGSISEATGSGTKTTTQLANGASVTVHKMRG